MKSAKHPSIKRVQRPVLPWAPGDLVRFYKMHGTGTGWHLCRVSRVDDKETTAKMLGRDRLTVTLPHSEFQRVEG